MLDPRREPSLRTPHGTRPHAALRTAAPLGTLALALALLFPGAARAHEFYALRVPNPVRTANSIGVVRPCITCHNNPDGGSGCIGADPYGAPDVPSCLNAFGTDFRGASFTWNLAIASRDADGDGFTNGQELQDPLGTWRPGQPTPGVAAHVTRPGEASSSPGRTDADVDRHCWFGRDLNLDGDCADPGENNGAFDCDDTRAAVNSSAAEICTNDVDNDCDGLPPLMDPDCAAVIDRDGDGFCPMGRDLDGDRDCLDPGESGGPGDCDDTRANVFPGASENCADGIDNDCNGLVDLADRRCTGDFDEDLDGYCPIGQDLNGDNDCLDPGEAARPGDCDDRDTRVNPGATEVCGNGKDDDCNGLVDFADPRCSSLADGDRDGWCPGGRDLDRDGNCTDAGEAGGVGDCDDTDPLVSPGAAEVCTNSRDDDCDGRVSLADPDCAGYLDADRDRYCFVGFDRNRDGDCADSGEDSGNTDCDDTNPLLNPAMTEVCTNGLDDDCNGSVDAFDPVCLADYFDFDGDGWCAVGPDLDADGDCADPGEQIGPGDAAAEDPTVSPGNGENCFDRKDNDQDGLFDRDDPDCTRDRDADGDGYCPIGRDVNGDGDCLDAGENFALSDCEDGKPAIHPGATEDCRNRKDDDCNGDVDMFDRACFYLLDRDGDGFCGMGIDDNGDGDCLDDAEDRFGADCDDTRPAIGPRAREICDDGLDNDCDGRADLRDPECGCVDAAGCDDGDPCTADACGEDGRCVSTPVAGCVAGDGGLPDGAGGEGGGATPPAGDGGCGCRAAGAEAGRSARFRTSRHAVALAAVGVAAAALGLRRARRRRTP
jgi:hypothetical protein